MANHWPLYLVTMTSLLVTMETKNYYPDCTYDQDCNLPECYCKYEDIPGNIPPANTPQMVLFTYTGALPMKVREKLTELFPFSLKNPNACSVAITVFIVSQGSDDCGIHKLYVRGHEIALAGMNKSTQVATWDSNKWQDFFKSQQFDIAENSNIDPADIVGVRAQKLRPGGDAQFSMLRDSNYIYDSSLLAGPAADNGFKSPYLWPFTLDKTLDQLKIPCKNIECPTSVYPGIWEVPVSPLVGTRMNKPRLCTYLDDCLSDYKKSSDVTILLKRHFQFNYHGNRAPLQINLQARTLTSDIAVQGIKDFIKYIMTMEDTWMVTTSELLTWVRSPTKQSVIMEQGFWDCPERIYVKCSEADGGNITKSSASFSDILTVDELWIWQSVVLIVLYIVVFRYDRDLQARKKK